jgi:1,4-dihydroxy-2-naphthoate polyprenyltransferase
MIALWRSARPTTLLLPLSPFALGGIAAGRDADFDAYAMLLALIAVVALHLMANWINDWWDTLSGVDDLAAMLPGSRRTAPGRLLPGENTLPRLQTASVLMLCIGMTCAALLTMRGLNACALIVVIGGILAISYTAPPISLAYRGHGSGEIAAALGYGVLPAMAACASQGVLNSRALLIGVPPGLIAAALLLIHDGLHPEADRQSGKQTPIVAFGADRAWLLHGMLIMVLYGMLAAALIAYDLPFWAWTIMLTAAPMIRAWLHLRPPASQDAILTAIQYATQTHVITTVLLAAVVTFA